MPHLKKFIEGDSMRSFDRRWLCVVLIVLPIYFSACGSSSSGKSTALAIATASLSGGVVGTPYGAGLQATGGTAPYTWSISTGALPGWATLSSSTGAITGTPTATGTTMFTVQVTDSETTPAMATQQLSIAVTAPTLSIPTNALPSGTLESPYSTMVLATGGVTPYTWSISAGSLPAWATLAPSTGVISGTPNATGTVTFTLQVADSETPPMTASGQFSINVPALAVTTVTLPNGAEGTPYSTTLAAVGGVAPYTWSIAAGSSLPTWAYLAPMTGVITGTPNAVATSSFTVQVTDSETPPVSATMPLSVIVTLKTLAVATTTLPAGAQGSAYAATLAGTGGMPPYVWGLTSGSLPPGTSIASATGIISGVPIATGTFSFTAQVSDSETPPATATGKLSITINSTGMNLDTELMGQYGFLVQGFDDATGGQHGAVGSFVADGNGNITSGEEDTNGPAGYNPAITFTGTYSEGPDNRGTATINDSLGGSNTFAFALGAISSAVASKGAIIEFDDTAGISGQRGAGGFCLQDVPSFGLASISGPYAFQFAGQDSIVGTRQVTTGAFLADGNGNLTGGQFDANDEGTVSTGAFTGTIATTSDTATFGRFTLTLSGGVSGTSVVYSISPSQLFSLGSGIEAADGLTGGQVLAQSSVSFTNASLANNVVFYSQGLGSIPGNSLTSIGLDNFDGAGDVTYSLDQDDSGTLSSPFGSGTYSVAANGRTPLTGIGTASPIFYLTQANMGFFSSTGSDVGAGQFDAQSGEPFSASSVTGSYYFGSVPPSVTGSSLSSGIFTSTGNGTLLVTSDESNINGLLPGVSMSDKLTVAANGRATDTLGNILYIISPTQVATMAAIDPNPVITTASQ
jgi:hypothetical protein